MVLLHSSHENTIDFFPFKYTYSYSLIWIHIFFKNELTLLTDTLQFLINRIKIDFNEMSSNSSDDTTLAVQSTFQFT